MTIIEQIKAEIEGWLREYAEDSQFELGERHGYKRLLSFLSTLESEKPMNQEGLEQEIIKCWQEWISPSNKPSVEGVLPLSEFAFYARHFAEWGAEHLKK